jgi:nicotinamidase-related amidase
MPHPFQMSAADTGLLVIDVQEKLVPKVVEAEALVLNIGFLIDAARLLSMPVQATEQYPRGLGPTVPELARRLPERPDKVAFSSCAVPSVVETFRRAARPKVVLTGIETHVCVLHTALDLLALEFRVFVVADAVSSRYHFDDEWALRRMQQAGAVVTTTETCLFEWVGGAGHPQFKSVSALVQERMKRMPPLPSETD